MNEKKEKELIEEFVRASKEADLGIDYWFAVYRGIEDGDYEGIVRAKWEDEVRGGGYYTKGRDISFEDFLKEGIEHAKEVKAKNDKREAEDKIKSEKFFNNIFKDAIEEFKSQFVLDAEISLKRLYRKTSENTEKGDLIALRMAYRRSQAILDEYFEEKEKEKKAAKEKAENNAKKDLITGPIYDDGDEPTYYNHTTGQTLTEREYKNLH